MDIVNKDTTPIQPLLGVFNGIVPMNSLCSLAPELAVEKINAYYKDIQSGENGRYLSWEHCYSFFAKQRNQPLDEEHIDLLCLHLAFYLASWGMYRGSSFLLQRDYRIHRNVVIEIFTAAYLPLWGVVSRKLVTFITRPFCGL